MILTQVFVQEVSKSLTAEAGSLHKSEEHTLSYHLGVF